MKNIRIRVVENCTGDWWWHSLCDGNKEIMGRSNYSGYERKGNAIRNAKIFAKRIGIRYDPEILKLHGC